MKTKTPEEIVSQLNLDVPENLRRQLKAKAALRGETLKDLAIRALWAEAFGEPGKMVGRGGNAFTASALAS